MGSASSHIGQWIADARRGDAGALGRLLATYRNYLSLTARTSLTADVRAKADPSDMAQETLIKAHANFEQFQGTTEAELIAWLRQILAHQIADLCRRYQAGSRQVSREISIDDAIHERADALLNFATAEEDAPSANFRRRETAVVVADALAELSREHREVIVLRSIQELDWPQVAEKMGRTPDAVRVLWARALKQLRPHIERRM